MVCFAVLQSKFMPMKNTSLSSRKATAESLTPEQNFETRSGGGIGRRLVMCVMVYTSFYPAYKGHRQEKCVNLVVHSVVFPNLVPFALNLTTNSITSSHLGGRVFPMYCLASSCSFETSVKTMQ